MIEERCLVHAKQWVQEGSCPSNEQRYLRSALLFSHFRVSHFGIVCVEHVIEVRAAMSVKAQHFFVHMLFQRQCE